MMVSLLTQLALGGVVWLIALQIAERPVDAITVHSGDTPLPTATQRLSVLDDGDDRNGKQRARFNASHNETVAYQSSRLDCSALPVQRPQLLLERSQNSLRLYLLDTTSGVLQRVEHTYSQGIDRSKVCTLPPIEDDPKSFQVLDVDLGGTAYVLFVVSSSEWHYVYMARSPPPGQQDSSSSESAQAIQRLKRIGETVRVRLLECSGQLYLVTIHTFGNMGKIRIYRWLQSYFSLVGTREVSSLDDIQCHCPGPLLLLALDYAPLPERSMNHVLLLDSAGTAPVKVQGMYFLSTRLPSFMIGGELFLVRQVTKDKSYLYQWSIEGRFIRQRMVSFQAAQVSAVATWDDTVAIAIGDTIRLYSAGRHNLLRMESTFTVRGNGTTSPPLTQVPIAPEVEPQELMRLYAFRTGSEEEIALALEYRCLPNITNGTALRVYQLTMESAVTARTEATQEQGFHTLSSCLQRLKERLNERKQWIDLVRLQLSKRQSAFVTLHQTGPDNMVLLQPTVQFRRLVLPHDNPSLLPPSRTVLNGQTLLLRHYRVVSDLNQVLLLNRPRADIKGDLHVGGNIKASSSNIRDVHGLEPITAIGERSKRTAWPHYQGPQPVRSVPHRIIVAREVIADSTIHKRFWSKSKATVLPGTIQLDVLSARSVRMNPRGQINHIAVPNKRALEEATVLGYGGHKVLTTVQTARLLANSVNGEPLPMQLLANGLHYVSDGATIQSDRAHIRNLIIRDTVNGYWLNRFVPVHQPLIQGHLVLSEEVCVRYLTVHRAIGGTNHSTLLDRVSVQTLTGPMFISKGFTHSLTVSSLNGEPSINYAVLPSEGPFAAHLLVQPTVRIAKLTILNTLIVDHERQQFGPHIGTLASDFRQLYSAKVVINGSFRLYGATKIGSPNITLDGPVVIRSPDTYQMSHYLLRSRRQVIDHQVTYQTGQLQYLFANTLNEVGIWQFSLTHFNWQNNLYLHDATVRGQIRATRIASRLHAIKRSRVTQHSTTLLCNTAKYFQGRLSVSHLRTSAFGAQLPTAALWLKGGQQHEAAPVTVSEELELHGTTLLVEGGTGLHTLTTLTSYPADTLFRRNAVAVSNVNQQQNQPKQQMRLITLKANLLTVNHVEKVELGAMMQRFAASGKYQPGYSTTATNSNRNRHWMAPSFAKIVLDAATPTQHIPLLTVDDINVCPIGRLLGETVRKHNIGTTGTGHRRPIEGYKHVQGSVTVTEELRAAQLNAHPAHILGQVVTRDHTSSSPVPQMIESHWQFGSIVTPYCTAKILNRTPLTLVALRKDLDLPLHDDLFVERFHLHALEWPHATTEGVRLDRFAAGHRPYSIAAINRCRCYGTVVDPSVTSGKDRKLLAPHELLLFTPLPGTNQQPIEGVIIFNTTEVHLGSVTHFHSSVDAIERIAKLCLRRNHSTDYTIVFHREQLLHGVSTTVRQSLRIGSGASLSVERVSEVSIAERLAPDGTGGVFLLGTTQMNTGGLIVADRKRFTGTGVITVRNLTLPTDESRLLRVLQTMTGASHDSPLLAVSLANGAIIEQILTAALLNYTPFEWFFQAFFRRVPPPETLNPKVPPQLTLAPRYIQDFRGTLTVANLHLRGIDTILHHINSIPLTDVVTRTTDNAAHQIVTGPKVFRSVRLDGPLSLHHFNGIAVTSIKKMIVSTNHLHGTRSQVAQQGGVSIPKAIIFNRPVKLDALWSKHTYDSPTASTVLSMNDAERSQQQQPGYSATVNWSGSRVLPAARIGAMNRRHSSIDTSFVRSVSLARATSAVSGGVRFQCSPDRRAIAILGEGPQDHGQRASEQHRVVPIDMGQEHHCRSVLGVAAINVTTNLLLIALQSSTETDTVVLALYTGDWRTHHQLRPLNMPPGITHRSLKGAALLTPDREDIMLALLVAPAASSHASSTVRIFRLEKSPLTAAVPELLRFAPFQTITSTAHISALLTSADGSNLVLQEHFGDSHQQQQHLYEYNSMAGWRESTDHLV
ncbi:hypothetical protein AND_001170 [Anopheles darlingi]|uniref:Uncharacterized protein n=1 Tax=Anopheles darlingi TaxID=43151 RepID=W5JVV9_ANODA|nr:hypothetical protein AND_001170 [Anopheles darlingi]